MAKCEIWTPNQIDLLIKLVRERTELYDQTCAGYSNINTVNSLWTEIKQFIPLKTEKQLKKKWQILRSGFRTRRGDSESLGLKKWAYFDALRFLEPHLSDRQSTASSEIANWSTKLPESGALYDEELESNIKIEEEAAPNEEKASTIYLPDFHSADDNSNSYGKKRKCTSDVCESSHPSSNYHFLMSLLDDMDLLPIAQLRQFKMETLNNLNSKLSNM